MFAPAFSKTFTILSFPVLTAYNSGGGPCCYKIHSIIFSIPIPPPLHPFSKNIAMNMLPHEKSVLGLLSRIRV
jgi:hypothetical protein